MKAVVLLLCLVAAASAEKFTINQYMRPIGYDRFFNLFKAIELDVKNRITGGVEAQPNSHPYQVGLFLQMEAGTAFCGGSLISTTYVMTAAHCIQDGRNQVSLITVVLGAHNIYDEENSLRIQSTDAVMHPDWNSLTLRNDIALIKLPLEVELSDVIKVIRLPKISDEDTTFEEVLATVSGWGKASDDTNQISPVLRTVDVPVISNTICNTRYLGVIQPTHICASGEGGKSSCNGDSGGPLTIDEDGARTQVGIVSFGIALGCEVGWPSAYTRTSKFLPWISETSGIPIRT